MHKYAMSTNLDSENSSRFFTEIHENAYSMAGFLT